MCDHKYQSAIFPTLFPSNLCRKRRYTKNACISAIEQFSNRKGVKPFIPDHGAHSRLFSPLPTKVRALHFYRGNISALSSLVDSRPGRARNHKASTYHYAACAHVIPTFVSVDTSPHTMIKSQKGVKQVNHPITNTLS